MMSAPVSREYPHHLFGRRHRGARELLLQDQVCDGALGGHLTGTVQDRRCDLAVFVGLEEPRIYERGVLRQPPADVDRALVVGRICYPKNRNPERSASFKAAASPEVGSTAKAAQIP
jgi:hypothetical protein